MDCRNVRFKFAKLFLAFMAGFIVVFIWSSFLPAAGTPEEKNRLADVNRVLGTNYEWSDDAYDLAFAEATYWHNNGRLGHRPKYYCYGHKGSPDNCANGWLGSSAHRNGIQRDFRSGMTGGAVATVGRTSYFAPVVIKSSVNQPKSSEGKTYTSEKYDSKQNYSRSYSRGKVFRRLFRSKL